MPVESASIHLAALARIDTAQLTTAPVLKRKRILGGENGWEARASNLQRTLTTEERGDRDE